MTTATAASPRRTLLALAAASPIEVRDDGRTSAWPAPDRGDRWTGTDG